MFEFYTILQKYNIFPKPIHLIPIYRRKNLVADYTNDKITIKIPPREFMPEAGHPSQRD